MNILDNVLSTLTLGAPQQFQNLQVFPLIGPAHEEPAYNTLDAALGTDSLRVTETSDAGTVREIRVRNSGSRAVLIIDGEELVGAKQNRTVNLTILVPPQSDLVVPVTCVEAGRWHARSAQFSSAPRTHFAQGRAAKSGQVTESLLARGVPAADQGQVWAAISAKAERLQATSPTDAMSDMFEAHAKRVEAFVNAIAAVDGQRGAVFAIDGNPLGLDLFDQSRTLRSMLPKLVRGYAIDAIDGAVMNGGTVPSDATVAVREFVTSIRNGTAQRFPTVGAGESWRFTSPGFSGGALIVDNTVVHASVFRA